MGITLSSLPGFQIVFQIRISADKRQNSFHVLCTDRRSPEIGVKDRTCPVHYHTHIRHMYGRHGKLDMGREHFNLRLCLILILCSRNKAAQLVHLYMNSLHHRLSAVALYHLLYIFIFQKHVNLRDTSV